jgi:hypothetical protein
VVGHGREAAHDVGLAIELTPVNPHRYAQRAMT